MVESASLQNGSSSREVTAAPSPRRKRIIVTLTGATGAVLGIKALLALRKLNVETHLTLSHWAEATIRYETDYTPSAVRSLADHSYSNRGQAAAISSGCFHAAE